MKSHFNNTDHSDLLAEYVPSDSLTASFSHMNLMWNVLTV